MEAKILNTLDELKRYKNKYRQLKSVVAEHKDKQEKDEKKFENVIKELRSQITETKKREECLKETLKENQKICEQLKAELVQLKDEFDSKRVQEKFEKSSIILNNILKDQRNPCIKTGLGFVQKENNDSSRKINNQPYSYAEAILKHSMKKEKLTSIG